MNRFFWPKIQLTYDLKYENFYVKSNYFIVFWYKLFFAFCTILNDITGAREKKNKEFLTIMDREQDNTTNFNFTEFTFVLLCLSTFGKSFGS